MTYVMDENDWQELLHLSETMLYLKTVVKMDHKDKFIFESIAFRISAVLCRLERDQLLTQLLAEKEKAAPTDEDYMAAMGPCGK